MTRTKLSAEQLVSSQQKRVHGPYPEKTLLGSITPGELPGSGGTMAEQSSAGRPWAEAGWAGRFTHFSRV